MQIKRIRATLLKVRKREGKSKKDGSPYLFYTGSVADDDGNVFDFMVSENLIAKQGEKLLVVRNAEVMLDVTLSPKGYDIGGSIDSVEFVK